MENVAKQAAAIRFADFSMSHMENVAKQAAAIRFADFSRSAWSRREGGGPPSQARR
jgi:hypothetical protein